MWWWQGEGGVKVVSVRVMSVVKVVSVKVAIEVVSGGW